MLINKQNLIYEDIKVSKEDCINKTCPCYSKNDKWLYINNKGYNGYVRECDGNHCYVAIREKTKGDILKENLKNIFDRALQMVEPDLLEKAVYKNIEDDCCTMTLPITTIELYNDSLGVSVKINNKICVDFDKY